MKRRILQVGLSLFIVWCLFVPSSYFGAVLAETPDESVITPVWEPDLAMYEALNSQVAKYIASFECSPATWTPDFSSPEAYTLSKKPLLDKLLGRVGPLPSNSAGRVIERRTLFAGQNYIIEWARVQSRLSPLSVMGYLAQPTQRVQPGPAVVLLHGAGVPPHKVFGWKLAGNEYYDKYVDAPLSPVGLDLVEAGYTVFVPWISDDESQWPYFPWFELDRWGAVLRKKTGQGGAYSILVPQIMSVLDFLATEEGIDTQKIALMGWWQGAQLAAVASALDDRVKAVVLLQFPIDRHAFRADSSVLALDSAYTAIDCIFSDTHFAALIAPRPLLFSHWENSPLSSLYARFVSPSQALAIESIYEGLKIPEKMSIMLGADKREAVTTIPVTWLNKVFAHEGFPEPKNSFTEQTGWVSQDKYTRFLADVNGDGMADIVGFHESNMYISFSTGSGFAPPITGSGAFAGIGGWVSQDKYPRFLADVNGDGRADIVGFGAAIYSALSEGAGFGPQEQIVFIPPVPSAWDYPYARYDAFRSELGAYLGSLGGCSGIDVTPDFTSVESFLASVESLRLSVTSQLTGGLLFPELPITLRERRVIADAGSYILEWVRFSGRFGDDINVAGYLATPKDSPGPFPAVISFDGNYGLDYLFGLMREETPYLNAYGDYLARSEHIVFAPYMPSFFADGWGAHFGERTNWVFTIWHYLTNLYLSSVDFMYTQPNVNKGNIVAYGISYAGVAALLTTAVDKRISTLAYSNPLVNVDLYFRDPSVTISSPVWQTEICNCTNLAEQYLIAPRRFIWENGLSDANWYQSYNMEVIDRVRETYKALNTEWSFRFLRHDGAHETRVENVCIDPTTQDKYTRFLADVNGDGMADIVGFHESNMYISFSTGSGFAPPITGSGAFAGIGGWVSQDKYPRFLADVNGDGRADIVGFGAAIYVGFSEETGFALSLRIGYDFTDNGGW